MKRLDKNENGIPDYIEAYALMIASLIIFIAGITLLIIYVKDSAVAQVSMRLILYGLGGLGADRLAENFRR